MGVRTTFPLSVVEPPRARDCATEAACNKARNKVRSSWVGGGSRL